MEFKAGDIVWCKPGHERGEDGDGHHGGGGYWPGRVFVVTQTDSQHILWPEKTSIKNLHPKCSPLPIVFQKNKYRIANGVYAYAVELYTGQDLEFYNTLKIIKEEIYGEENNL